MRSIRPTRLFLAIIASALGLGVFLSSFVAERPEAVVRKSLPVETSVAESAGRVVVLKEPPVAAFDEWTASYCSASSAGKTALVAKGMQLANERRAVLSKMIRAEPERALAVAVPMVVREQMPPDILPLIEERVSGVGDVSRRGVKPKSGKTVAEPTYLAVAVNGREYRAHTFGARAGAKQLRGVGIHGIALDGRLALSDSPVRVLERGEKVNGKPVEAICAISGVATPLDETGPLNLGEVIAFDTGEKIRVACEPSHVAEFASRQAASERTAARTAANGGQGSSGVSGRPTQAWTHGTKKVLIIRVDFSDLAGAPVNAFPVQTVTETFAVSVINGANGVRDFYEQNSFGKTTLSVGAAVGGDSPDVTGVLRMPATAASYATTDNNDGLHTAARNAATAAGFNLANYDRIGVVFSDLSNIPGSFIDYGGLGDVDGPYFWTNGAFDFTVVAHEIGHNYGLEHSNLWSVSDGNPVSASGTSVEYGDEFDVMGDGTDITHHFSLWNKSILQWLPDAAVTTVTTGGTYRVYRFDAQGANLANRLGLKIVRNATQDYWIGHRRATTNAALDNGAYVIWGYNQNQQGNLLDMATPGTSVADAALQVGATFTDTVAGITLNTVARGGTGNDEWIDVQVTLQPRIQFETPTLNVSEQAGSAVINVTRTNSATGAVSVNYATSAGTATSPEDFTATSGTLNWANGDSSTKTITVPIISDALNEGKQSFTVTLSGISGGILNGSSAAVTIIDPGVADPAYAPDFINNTIEKALVLPDGKILAAGWFFSVQDAGFVSYSRRGIVRLNADGSVDPTFATGGGVTGGASPRVLDIARQSDGKIIIGGTFTTVNGVAHANVARLNSDGSLDATFITVTDDAVYSVLAQADGKVVIGGAFTTVNAGARRMLARLNADGSADSSFTPPTFGAGSGWRVEALALQTDGKVMVGGNFYFSGLQSKQSICRVLGTTGALDAAFSGVTDGAHVAGTPGTARTVGDIIVLGDGRILISGDFTAFNSTARGGIARLTSIGGLDATFAPASNGNVDAMRLQPDGKILIGGTFTSFNGAAANRLARITAAGANDAGFIAAGGTTGAVNDIALQPDGRVLLVGDFGNFQGSSSSRPHWRFYAGLPALPGTVQLSAQTHAGIEGTTLSISATRTGGSAGAISVGYATVAGTATAADFTSASGSLSWADGDSAAKTITIPITADGLADSGELLFMNLGQPIIGAAILGAAQQSTVTISSAFAAWQSANFTALELTDSNISGDLADPDGDGRNNLTEFALGFSPKIPDGTNTLLPGTTNISGSNYLTLTFRRRTPALDLTYTVQNNDLLGTSWTATALQVGAASSNGDGTETVTFRDDTAVSSTTQRYLRLQIQRAP